MNDAEFVFNQTSFERKRIARGSYNKVRAGGRNVKMPSDYLSRKEKRELNGEVKSYNLSKVMNWGEFRGMPLEIQQEYLDGIARRFPGIPNTLIAEAMKTTRSAFSVYLSNRKMSVHQPGGKHCLTGKVFLRSEDGYRFVKWARGESEEKDEIVEYEPPEEVENEVAEEMPKVEKVDADGMDLNNIAVLLRSLKGSGAKLTIEIVL